MDECVVQQLRYGIVCSECSGMWISRSVLRYNCIGASVSHTAHMTLRACTLLAHSEGAIQIAPEFPGALDSEPACTLHLIDNVAYMDESREDDKLFKTLLLKPRHVIDRNNLLVLHTAPPRLCLPEYECPEVYATDGSLIDIDEFAFEIDPVTGRPGQSRTLPPGWRTEWVATRTFGRLEGEEGEIGGVQDEDRGEDGQQLYAWYINDEEGRMQLSHPLVDMRLRADEEREIRRYQRSLARQRNASDGLHVAVGGEGESGSEAESGQEADAEAGDEIESE